MSECGWRRVREVLEEALDLPSGERFRFLDRACGSDAALRNEVDSLLARADEADLLLEGAPVGGISEREGFGAPSLIGRSLTHYEMVGELGRGGMGVVYRARDTELGRDVAIKLLPEDFTRDPERLARLEREARVLASLNHPNITTIHELGRTENSLFLVLELVSGPGLDERISRGPVPLTETLALARQIAEALEAAHEQGIVHRDLKPANIKMTEAGRIKILDFGLAKSETSSEETGPSHSPTLPREGTASGVILGTASYMSPEQARGQPIDKRADIWAFGCVLFESLTGRRAFSGETTSDVIAGILEREPEWEALPKTTPPVIRALLRRCLERDRDRRLHDIADARIEIEAAVGKRGSTVAATGGSRMAWMVGAAAVLGGMVWILTTLAGKGDDDAAREILEPKFTQLTSQAGEELFPSFSPSGDFFVYSASTSGQRDIHLRRVGGVDAINLTPDSPFDDTQPAFSPGGDKVAFRSDREGGGIFVMGARGESVRRVTDHGFNPSWSPEGRGIVFSTESAGLHTVSLGHGRLEIVRVDTGEVRVLETEGSAYQPQWSPHGHRIVFWSNTRSKRWRDIWTVSPETGDVRPITHDEATDWNPVWSPDGRLVYFTSAREGTTSLWRIAVEEKTGGTIGSAEFAATSVPADMVHLSLSGDGRRIAYVALQSASNLRQVSFDPATGAVVGEPVWITRTSKDKFWPAVSPDGRWVAFSLQGAGSAMNIALVRPDGTGLRMLTTDLRERNFMPNWSPDGSQIAFYSSRNSEKYELWTVRADGSGLQQLTKTPHGIFHLAWSPNSSAIAVRGGVDTYIFDSTAMSEGERLRKLSRRRGMFEATSWSPDGQWLAGIHYDWNPGSPPSPVPKVALLALYSEDYRVLTEGTFPKWLIDGRRLVFQKADGLYLLDSESGKYRRVLPVSSDPAVIYQGIDLSRDGRTIYYTERTTESDIWMLTLEPVP